MSFSFSFWGSRGPAALQQSSTTDEESLEVCLTDKGRHEEVIASRTGQRLETLYEEVDEGRDETHQSTDVVPSESLRDEMQLDSVFAKFAATSSEHASTQDSLSASESPSKSPPRSPRSLSVSPRREGSLVSSAASSPRQTLSPSASNGSGRMMETVVAEVLKAFSRDKMDPIGIKLSHDYSIDFILEKALDYESETEAIVPESPRRTVQREYDGSDSSDSESYMTDGSDTDRDEYTDAEVDTKTEDKPADTNDVALASPKHTAEDDASLLGLGQDADPEEDNTAAEKIDELLVVSNDGNSNADGVLSGEEESPEESNIPHSPKKTKVTPPPPGSFALKKKTNTDAEAEQNEIDYGYESFSLQELIEKRLWLGLRKRVRENPELARQVMTKDSAILSSSSGGNLLLHEVCKNEPTEDIVEVIADSNPLAVKTRGQWDYYPLHYACTSNASVDVLDSLIARYPDAVCSRDCNDLMLPLHLACKWGAGKYSLALLLTTYPEASKVRDIYGKTPFDYAMEIASQDLRQEAIDTLQWGSRLLEVQEDESLEKDEEEDNQDDREATTREGVIEEMSMDLALDEVLSGPFYVPSAGIWPSKKQNKSQEEQDVNVQERIRSLQKIEQQKKALLDLESKMVRNMSDSLVDQRQWLEDKIQALEENHQLQQQVIESLEKDLEEAELEMEEALVDQELTFNSMLEAEQAKVKALTAQIQTSEETHLAYTHALLESHEKETEKFRELTQRFQTLESNLRADLLVEVQKREALEKAARESEMEFQELEMRMREELWEEVCKLEKQAARNADDENKIIELEAKIAKLQELLKKEHKKVESMTAAHSQLQKALDNERSKVESLEQVRIKMKAKIESTERIAKAFENAKNEAMQMLENEQKEVKRLEELELERLSTLEFEKKKARAVQKTQARRQAAVESLSRKVKGHESLLAKNATTIQNLQEKVLVLQHGRSKFFHVLEAVDIPKEIRSQLTQCFMIESTDIAQPANESNSATLDLSEAPTSDSQANDVDEVKEGAPENDTRKADSSEEQGASTATKKLSTIQELNVDLNVNVAAAEAPVSGTSPHQPTSAPSPRSLEAAKAHHNKMLKIIQEKVSNMETMLALTAIGEDPRDDKANEAQGAVSTQESEQKPPNGEFSLKTVLAATSIGRDAGTEDEQVGNEPSDESEGSCFVASVTESSSLSVVLEEEPPSTPETVPSGSIDLQDDVPHSQSSGSSGANENETPAKSDDTPLQVGNHELV